MSYESAGERRVRRFQRATLSALQAIQESINSLVRYLAPCDYPPQHTPKTNVEQDGTGKKSDKTDKGSPAITVRAKTELPQEIIDRYDASQRQSYRHQRWLIRAQIATFIAAAGAVVAASIYAHVTSQQREIMDHQWATSYAQLMLNKKSFEDAEKTMRLDERAWIRIGGPTATNLAINQPIDVPLLLGVVGKTPAKKVTGDVAAQLLKPTQDPDFVYTTGHPHSHLPPIVILPNTEIHQTLNVLRDVSGQKKPQIVLLNKEIQNGLESGDLVLVIHGRLTYEDIFGVSHWVKFCTFAAPTLRKGGPTKCNEYNDVDSNE